MRALLPPGDRRGPVQSVMSRSYCDRLSSRGSLRPGRWAGAIQDLELALMGSWLIASVLSACVVLAALVLPERVVLSAGLLLQVSHQEGACVLCGMTRALVAIGNGNVSEALALQRGSIAFVVAVLASCVAAAVVLLRRVRGATSRDSSARA